MLIYMANKLEGEWIAFWKSFTEFYQNRFEMFWLIRNKLEQSQQLQKVKTTPSGYYYKQKSTF
jgi:hypothetical protein